MRPFQRIPGIASAVLILSLAQCGGNASEDYAAGIDSFDKDNYEVAAEYFSNALATGDLSTDRQATALNYRGMAYGALDQSEAAQADFMRAAVLDPEFHCPHANLGNLAASKMECAQAIQHYSRAMELYPDYPMAVYNRHVARLLTHDYGGAFADHQELLRLDPDLAGVFRPDRDLFLPANDCRRPIPDPLRLLAVARAALRRGDPDSARPILEGLGDDPALAQDVKAGIRHDLAAAAFAQAVAGKGSFAEAEALCAQAVDAAPLPDRNPETLYLLGVCALRQGEESRAEAAFTRLAADSPGDPRLALAGIAQGEHRLVLGEPEKAAEAFRACLEAFPQTPSTPDAALDLLRTLAGLDRFADAEPVAQYLFSRWPGLEVESPELLLLAGEVRAALGRGQEAKEHFLALYNLDPTAPLGASATRKLLALLAAENDAAGAAALNSALEALGHDAAQDLATNQAIRFAPPLPFLLPLPGGNGRYLVLFALLEAPDDLSSWDMETSRARLRHALWAYLTREDPARLAACGEDLASSMAEVAGRNLDYGRCPGARITRCAAF